MWHMNKQEILRKITLAAKRDVRRRRDTRYRLVMGFLTAKGFLRTNQALPLLPNIRIPLEDAIWAGKYVEPRILEVLPAAIIRLPNHFQIEREKHKDLLGVVDRIKAGEKDGPNLWDIPFEKFRPWVDLPLRDK